MAEDLSKYTDQGLIDRINELEDSIRKWANMRSRFKTLDDAMDAYDALIEDAHKTIAKGFAEQAATLRSIGRKRSGNTQWRMDPRVALAKLVIEDHEGAQSLLAEVKALDYGMDLLDYEVKRCWDRIAIAEYKQEQVRREAELKTQQVQKVYEAEMQRIGDLDD